MNIHTKNLYTKNISTNEAKKLIYKIVSNSDYDTLSGFWIIELSNVYLTEKDSNIYNQIIKLKSKNDDISKSLYYNVIKGNVFINLLKKNWRRLFNNNIIEKYYEYSNKGDKIWKMGEPENLYH